MRLRPCGPRAVGKLAGIPPELAECEIRKIRRAEGQHGRPERAIVGAQISECTGALRALGFSVVELAPAAVVPGARRLRDLDGLAGSYLVLIPGHWLALVNGRAFDWSAPKGRRPARHRSAGAEVRQLFRVDKKGLQSGGATGK